MEGGVEHGHVRNAGQRSPRLVDRLERRSHVQRGELREFLELAPDAVVDQDRLVKARAPVDDPVRDGLDRRRLGQRVDRFRRVVLGDRRQFERASSRR